MSKVAIIYWSGTGNTEEMANSVIEGLKKANAQVSVFSPNDFNKDLVSNFDAFAFGCPAMGSEVLEEDEFQPMWDSILPILKDKKVVLFGSYDWGDGEWLRLWEEESKKAGINIVCDCIMANNEPTEQDKIKLENMGLTLGK